MKGNILLSANDIQQTNPIYVKNEYANQESAIYVGNNGGEGKAAALEYIKQANVYLKVNDFKKADPLFNNAVLAGGSDESVRKYASRYYSYKASFTLKNAGTNGLAEKRSQILDDVNRALELDGSSSYAYYAKACFANFNKDSNSAMENLTKAIELKPDFASAYSIRSVLHVQSGDVSNAVGDLKMALEHGKKDSKEYQADKKQLRNLVFRTLDNANKPKASGDDVQLASDVLQKVEGVDYKVNFLDKIIDNGSRSKFAKKSQKHVGSVPLESDCGSEMARPSKHSKRHENQIYRLL